MSRAVFFCRNNGADGSQPCPNRLEVNSNAKPLILKDEYQSAWNFQCPVCRGFQVFTKDMVGGTFGQGRRDNMAGPTTNKGLNRYRPGVDFSPR